MKLPLLLVSACLALSTSMTGQPPQLVRLWETEPTLKVPEGVHFDSERQVLYVSNIDGTEPWAKDGAGSIAKVSLEGKVLAAEWISGLHAPKGLARHGNRLYAADVQQLIVIDLKAGKIIERLDVPEAQRLNDVSANPDGVVYVTDSQTGKVHRWEDGRLSVFSTAFKTPNGVLATADAVYVLDQETLHRVDANGKPAVVAKGITGHVDGVEQDGKDFLVTCWEGMTYHVGANGQVTQLLDTRAEKANAADPAFDPKKRILYVPTFWKNTVVAYEVTDRE